MLSFGFGAAGSSLSAGVVATALAFGLVLLVLAYSLGRISGRHINPAVTMGFLVARRITMQEAVGYWVAQLAADGFGALSTVGLNAVGAIAAEIKAEQEKAVRAPAKSARR